ncbi:MAG: hypothetical protein JRL30_28235 [Deltaproteobacteria bacterium]|nr:hypothetical protein [Deltaproteobacteria bacterium]
MTAEKVRAIIERSMGEFRPDADEESGKEFDERIEDIVTALCRSCPSCGKVLTGVRLYYEAPGEAEIVEGKVVQNLNLDVGSHSDEPTSAECECGYDLMKFLDAQNMW